jgi:hypothetical protein
VDILLWDFVLICSGGSGHARIKIPDDPCLACNSAGGSLKELNGVIVIDLTNREWSRVTVCAVFSLWVLFNHSAVSESALMRDASGIFPFVVLNNVMSLAFFCALPICLKGNIMDGVAAEH